MYISLLDFRVTFQYDEYIVTENGNICPRLLLFYPEEYNKTMFAEINVTVAQVNITATGETDITSITMYATSLMYCRDLQYISILQYVCRYV